MCQYPYTSLVESKRCLITFDGKAICSTTSAFQKEPLLHLALEPFNLPEVSDGVVTTGQFIRQ